MKTKIQLSKAQKDHYLNEGYLILENVLDHGILDEVRDELSNEIDKRARLLHEKGELKKLYEDEGFETRLAKISSETPKLAVSIWNGVLNGPAIFNLITSEGLLDIAENFCGKEIIASSVYRVRPKIPNFGYGEVPWHQDSSYFEPFCDESLIVIAWVPLVDANKENGCLYVIPKSHKGNVLQHGLHQSGKYLEITEEIPEDMKVACEIPKGGVLLLTNKVIHGSFRNSTDKVRWSMDLRYQNAKYPTNAKISRLQDELTENTEAGVPAACYPPEADFLVRSEKRPNQVIKTSEEFHKLRENHVIKPVTNRFGVQWKAMEEEL